MTGAQGRSIPSLDGLRALSVGAVIASHLILGHAGEAPAAWGARWVPGLGALGLLGVRAFFVISGYLITTLLVNDQEHVGQVRLGRFYFRRVLRIFPPYYAFLAVMLLATLLGTLPSVGRWWPAWLYVSNVVPTGNWRTAHSWSLAVEEQFYLTWPFVLAWAGRSRAARIAVVACVAMPLLRAAVAVATESSLLGSMAAFDFLAVGCLLALKPAWVERVLAWSAARGRIVVALAVLVTGAECVRGAVPSGWSAALELLVLESAEAGVLGLVVAWCVTHPVSVVGQLLNARPLRVIGIGSYSLYLWQQPFCAGSELTPTVLGALLATGATAALSYYLVERLALVLRSRVERLRALTGRQAVRAEVRD